DPLDSSKFELELQNGCLYRITFPNLRPDVHVAGVSLDVDSGNAQVVISGQSAGSTTHVQGKGKQHVFLGEQHVGPSGLEVGPIPQILVFAQPRPGTGFPEVHIENVTALVVPNGAGNRPPVAGDDTATVAPGQTVTVAVLANDFDPDG